MSTLNRRPQNCSISGMNGSDSSSPFSSSVARISACAAHLDDLADTQVEHLVRWCLCCLHAAPGVVDVDDPADRRSRPRGVAARAGATALSTTSAGRVRAAGARSVRRTPSRRAREVSGSAARCIASASADASVGSTTIPFTPSCTIVPTAPVIGETTTGAPALSASTTTRPTKSWQRREHERLAGLEGALEGLVVHRPEEADRVLDAEPGELDQRVALRAVADDPERARAELAGGRPPAPGSAGRPPSGG